MSDRHEGREAAAATLAAALIQGLSLSPAQAVRTYYEVLDALNAENVKRDKSPPVADFNRKLEYPDTGH